jgi:hypothetical protein
MAAILMLAPAKAKIAACPRPKLGCCVMGDRSQSWTCRQQHGHGTCQKGDPRSSLEGRSNESHDEWFMTSTSNQQKPEHCCRNCKSNLKSQWMCNFTSMTVFCSLWHTVRTFAPTCGGGLWLVQPWGSGLGPRLNHDNSRFLPKVKWVHH